MIAGSHCLPPGELAAPCAQGGQLTFVVDLQFLSYGKA